MIGTVHIELAQNEDVRYSGSAIDVATELRSERTKQPMSPLAAAAARHPRNTDARDLLERIGRLRGVAVPHQVAHRDVPELRPHDR